MPTNRTFATIWKYLPAALFASYGATMVDIFDLWGHVDYSRLMMRLFVWQIVLVAGFKLQQEIK